MMQNMSGKAECKLELKLGGKPQKIEKNGRIGLGRIRLMYFPLPVNQGKGTEQAEDSAICGPKPGGPEPVLLR